MVRRIGEEVLKRRVDEEVRKELEQLRIDEERVKEEELRRHEAEKEVPGITVRRILLMQLSLRRNNNGY